MLEAPPDKKAKIKPSDDVFVHVSNAEKGPNGKEIDLYGWAVASGGTCTDTVKLLYVIGCLSHVYSRPHTFAVSVTDKQARLIRFYHNVGTAPAKKFETFSKRAEVVLLKDLKSGSFYKVLRSPPSWATLIPKES